MLEKLGILKTVEDIKKLTDNDIEFLSEQISKSLLIYYDTDDLLVGILNFKVSLPKHTTIDLYSNTVILSWNLCHNNHQYGNFTLFDKKISNLEKKIIVEKLFKQIQEIDFK